MQEDRINNNAAASPVEVWDGWAQGLEPRGVEAGVAQPLAGGFARKTGATLTLHDWALTGVSLNEANSYHYYRKFHRFARMEKSSEITKAILPLQNGKDCFFAEFYVGFDLPHLGDDHEFLTVLKGNCEKINETEIRN